MSILKRLFGGGDGGAKAATATGEEYAGFMIYAAPVKEAGGYRVSARIEKEIEGELKTHQMIRADVVSSHEEAMTTTTLKAKSLIDQQGDAIF